MSDFLLSKKKGAKRYNSLIWAKLTKSAEKREIWTKSISTRLIRVIYRPVGLEGDAVSMIKLALELNPLKKLAKRVIIEIREGAVE